MMACIVDWKAPLVMRPFGLRVLTQEQWLQATRRPVVGDQPRGTLTDKEMSACGYTPMGIIVDNNALIMMSATYKGLTLWVRVNLY